MKYIKKRYMLLVFIILILLFLFLTKDIIYPPSINQSVSLHSLDGQQIQAHFDITFHDYLLYEPRLSGTIQINNTIYYKTREHEPNMGCTMSTQVFMKQYTTTESMLRNIIHVTRITEDMNEICMLVTAEENGAIYYGPSETVEEAQQILENLFK